MSKKLRIAVVVPPFTTVPAKGQAGIERIAYAMIEGLKKRGYKVTLFGAGKCKTSAKFVQIFKKTITEREFDSALLEASRPLRIEAAFIAKVMEEIIKREKEFDIIFSHARAGYLLLPLSRFLKIPIIIVLHLPIFKEMADLLSLYKKPNIVTLSNSQRKGFPNINYLTTVYNGVNTNEFKFCPNPKDYFLSIGAMGEHKNPKDAILAAKKARVKLILAGGKKREPYFSKEIKPLIDGKQIKYIGEISGKKLIDTYKYAKAVLFPSKISGAFSLVTIEAMSCGTPVIAYPTDVSPEIIKDGKTGFIVKNVDEMAEAIKKIGMIDRRKCREKVEKCFSIEKMVDNYEKIIKKILRKK